MPIERKITPMDDGARVIELDSVAEKDVDRQLARAKLEIEADRPREAAVAMFIARERYGASQQNIAAAVGRCQAWVSRMIQWRRKDLKETPFGPASKDERMWARFRRLTGVRMPGRILRSRYGNRQG